jgi:hypothetical protein
LGSSPCDDTQDLLKTVALRVYEVRPRSDKRGFDLISDVLPFGRLWYGEPNAISNAIGTRSIAADHMMPSFAFTMMLAM